jgi:restriction system protein
MNNDHRRLFIGEKSVRRPAPPTNLTMTFSTEAELPFILVQSEIVVFGDKTSEGQLVTNVGLLFFEIIKRLKDDPDSWFTLDWRKLEELVAGAWKKTGYAKVELTPRSGDGGRDVIATWPEIGHIRIFDQIKHHKTSKALVERDDVDALLGVLTKQGNVSKGIITTTTDFAPGVYKDQDVKRLLPHRLELKNGQQLRDWLIRLQE